MSILEKRNPQVEIRKTMKILQFFDNVIELVGTSSLKSQLYPSDYDFMTKINKTYPLDYIFVEFMDILKQIQDENNLYFIEFKFQNKDGTKFKINKIEDYTHEIFKKHFNINKIEFCKIDLIINLNNMNEFKEVSCIYFFNHSKNDISIDEYLKSLKQDQVELYNEGKYYKSLKRLLIISKLKDDLKMVEKLTTLFNSEIGKLYLLKNEIEASQLFLNSTRRKPDYKNNQKRVKLFLSNNGLKGLRLSQMDEVVKIYDKMINDAGLQFYKDNKITLKNLNVLSK